MRRDVPLLAAPAPLAAVLHDFVVGTITVELIDLALADRAATAPTWLESLLDRWSCDEFSIDELRRCIGLRLPRT